MVQTGARCRQFYLNTHNHATTRSYNVSVFHIDVCKCRHIFNSDLVKQLADKLALLGALVKHHMELSLYSPNIMASVSTRLSPKQVAVSAMDVLVDLSSIIAWYEPVNSSTLKQAQMPLDKFIIITRCYNPTGTFGIYIYHQ